MGQEAAGQVSDRGEDKDEQRQGPRIYRQLLSLHKRLEPQQHSQRCQKMSPHIDHLIVLLEEAKEVVPPVLAGGTVPGVDVRLTEELRHLALFDRTRHLGEAILQQPGETAEVLPAEGQRADPLQDGCHLAACSSPKPGSGERCLRAL